jgi:hypothetical protein
MLLLVVELVNVYNLCLLGHVENLQIAKNLTVSFLAKCLLVLTMDLFQKVNPHFHGG